LVWAGAAEEFGVGLGVEGWDERVSRLVALDALGEIFECATGGADFCVCGVGILAAERLELLASLGGVWRVPFGFAGGDLSGVLFVTIGADGVCCACCCGVSFAVGVGGVFSVTAALVGVGDEFCAELDASLGCLLNIARNCALPPGPATIHPATNARRTATKITATRPRQLRGLDAAGVVTSGMLTSGMVTSGQLISA